MCARYEEFVGFKNAEPGKEGSREPAVAQMAPLSGRISSDVHEGNNGNEPNGGNNFEEGVVGEALLSGTWGRQMSG